MRQKVERTSRVDIELGDEVVLVLKLYEVLRVCLPALDVLSQRQVVLEDKLKDLPRTIFAICNSRIWACRVWFLEDELVLITGFLNLGLEVFEFGGRHEDANVGVMLFSRALIVHVQADYPVEAEEGQLLNSLVVLRAFEQDVGEYLDVETERVEDDQRLRVLQVDHQFEKALNLLLKEVVEPPLHLASLLLA